MKININFRNFKSNHIKKKNQILFIEKRCTNYKKIENIYNLILSKKIALFLSLLKREKLEADIL